MLRLCTPPKLLPTPSCPEAASNHSLQYAAHAAFAPRSLNETYMSKVQPWRPGQLCGCPAVLCLLNGLVACCRTHWPAGSSYAAPQWGEAPSPVASTLHCSLASFRQLSLPYLPWHPSRSCPLTSR